MATNQKNKVKYGIRNAHWAKLSFDEEGNPVYGDVKRWPGSVSIGMDAEGEPSTFYADDMSYFVTVANNGYSGDYESALIPDDFLQEIMHYVRDKDGVLIEDSNLQPESFAFMFEFEGDKHAVRRVFYNCKMTRPSVSGETTENTKEPSTESGTITASPLILPEPITINGEEIQAIVQGKVTAETKANIYNDWYKSVHLPQNDTPETLGTLNVTSAAGADTGKTKLTVSPALTSGNNYRYKTGASVTSPAYDEDCASMTEWDGKAEITAASGQKILVVECTGTKARKAGTATVTVKA